MQGLPDRCWQATYAPDAADTDHGKKDTAMNYMDPLSP